MSKKKTKVDVPPLKTQMQRLEYLIGVFDGTQKSMDEMDDIEQEDYESLAAVFRKSIEARPWPKSKPFGVFMPCGTVDRWGDLYRGEKGERVEHPGVLKDGDQAAQLYRMLYLVKPKKVDFSDMYKTTLFRIYSPDRRFMASFELFKYEPMLFFYCRNEDLINPKTFHPGDPENPELTPEKIAYYEAHQEEYQELCWQWSLEEEKRQQAGDRVPWSSRAMKCKVPEGRKFFEMLSKAMQYEWDVYPGNNFKV